MHPARPRRIPRDPATATTCAPALLVLAACTSAKATARPPAPTSATSGPSTSTTSNGLPPSSTTWTLPPGARFTVTPHEIWVGNTVTFSGTGCPRAGDHSSPRSAVRRRAAERALTSCLGVTPMTHAGRIASLEVRGIGVCPRDPPPGLVELRLHPPGEDPSIPGGILPAATADPDGTGHWSGTIPVPATAEPGRYVLSASCTYSRAETAWYTGVPVTIG